MSKVTKNYKPTARINLKVSITGHSLDPSELASIKAYFKAKSVEIVSEMEKIAENMKTGEIIKDQKPIATIPDLELPKGNRKNVKFELSKNTRRVFDSSKCLVKKEPQTNEDNRCEFKTKILHIHNIYRAKQDTMESQQPIHYVY